MVLDYLYSIGGYSSHELPESEEGTIGVNKNIHQKIVIINKNITKITDLIIEDLDIFLFFLAAKIFKIFLTHKAKKTTGTP